MAGRVEEAEYVVLQPEAEGSVRQAFTVVMSLVRVTVEHAVVSHLAARTYIDIVLLCNLIIRPCQMLPLVKLWRQSRLRCNQKLLGQSDTL